jgi:hypothetical protein
MNGRTTVQRKQIKENNSMSTLTTSINISDLRQRLWGSGRLLTASAIIYFALFIGAIVASLLDARILTGAPVWIKPMKFAISSILYTATLAWMFSYITGRSRLIKFLAGSISLLLLFEVSLIVMQAARGVQSHFNFSTPFDTAVFNVMGSLIMIIWVLSLVAAVLLLRQKMADRAFAWGLRLGLLVSLVGAMLGFTMVRPTPQQLADWESGKPETFIGAHSVGVEDGGEGLPFTGWSTKGGDLRVSHFVGLHAMQMLPLAAIFINRRFGRLNESRRASLVWITALGYLGFIALVFWQAMRGQPLIAPDATTLAALAALVTAVIAASGLVILSHKETPAILSQSKIG